MTDRPNGIVLVTGPTGSGKTTTLYSTLKSLATPEVNVCTIEDPIEMIEPAFNQMQVQRGIDLGLRRGRAHADAPGPGHHHGGRDPRPRDRRDGGAGRRSPATSCSPRCTPTTRRARSRACSSSACPAYLLNATLIGVMAQRLVRTLCPHCKQTVELHRAEDQEAWDALVAPWKSKHPARLYKPVGCLECRMTGYMGRVGIYETLLFTVDQELVSAKRRPGRAARAGVQGRHEAAAHLRRDEGRRRPHHDRRSAQGRAAGARPAARA